jgi:hypothetical protein
MGGDGNPAGQFAYPALYIAANQASNDRQKFYLRLIVLEYVCLFAAACLSVNFAVHNATHSAYAVALVASLIALLVRTRKKPEQDWYKMRALAESVKTASWRYVTRARPFEGDEEDAQRAFHELLKDLRKDNVVGVALPADPPEVTVDMGRKRTMAWAEGRDYYRTFRIRDQYEWYIRKAKYNRLASRLWAIASITLYIIAIILAGLRIGWPNWEYWPIEPALVVASAFLGWIQIKRFNELATSYELAAREIKRSDELAASVASAADLADFVNKIELAFSREHTQWAARIPSIN